ncbi:ribonuclease III [Candidatus Berkelbacteria bacterium CG_4_10_14_0_8_um_filter_35_9_33_8]|uniref:Ribonuclease 3 n=1 Tax=Candidatus Berkelbacteria bacterium CG_4_10_14_0_2_um_filter_35_9_33_12 TaxID=1974499 RepID=A0A2M7W3Y5_9BACT|nr:MAG: ribonuclease III [Candidatus Berkelbacteria bacterium CG23_combo_of_CG06-09_8_20_14_all_33_15]PIS08230.1 MAG: ribonuclease III [Candidatus Berkelbacteria bacterium CG10_big_fil_rev_8_21_14_0_10_33_10]PIZ28447.1 MAG: ribonuclease III [Candidatus Berkelbacteria bacterium CG_4_10_14_0_8_um_filter_35_9_33_8]PJA20123.1 MAG: ribonuclease III [Candidatus Berkelbacteria bacterium CG_4_10_14_0_2_um_filter_35_9_33_12]
MNKVDKKVLIDKFLDKISVKFKNKDLVRQAFVHRSYLNENPNFDLNHNERLEFLGDAVLELVVTEYLYTNYPNPEGELTNWRSALVKGETLSKIAKDLKMEELLYLSKGETNGTQRARDLILANAFEALIGAIYLDLTVLVVEQFIIKYVIIRLPEILKDKTYLDSKSRLQEYAQAQYGYTPEYKVISETGPDHDKKFIVEVYVGSIVMGKGEGLSKREAQQNAASNAAKKLIAKK